MSELTKHSPLWWFFVLPTIGGIIVALFLWRVLANMLRNQRMLDAIAAYGQSVNENSPARLMSEGER